ncbi:amidohydrolase [Proteiniborus sp. DW1]|uniref:M20 family metallopeptidase n=1 Tax=Proteiniborus sp. DW1 TaxID=1889883 RepID=UPI00092E066B|nr:M20 family metallopeptidase [Proteiniborus sp. DW1]SCG81828.1 amidohydrolase [Proteiniborus sp. DW1]
MDERYKEYLDRVLDEIDNNKESFISTSTYIWENPEIGHKEFKAMEALVELLRNNGFQIETRVAGLDTAFLATVKGKKPGPTIALMAEYDALEGLGHACGHNLFSVSAVATAIGLKKVIQEIGGTIKVIGTPAEEGTVKNAGGKAIMAEKGIFDDVDIAMICHAEGRTIIERRLVAATVMEVSFTGKAAHAGGSPEKGINALTAGVLTINNINALRQHFLQGTIVNPVIIEGGIGHNTIPHKCEMKMSIRATNREILKDVLEMVERCISASAYVTGCKYSINMPNKVYEDLRPNHSLALVFKEALEYLGIDYIQAEDANYSWDAGNISHLCPTIAPYIKIGSPELVGHTEEFKKASCSKEGFNGMIVGAKAMAMTALKYILDKDFRDRVSKEFLAK